MLRSHLKFFLFCAGLAAFLFGVPFAGGEICPVNQNEKLRIIYNGGLNGIIEPCG
jgi:hypothetical protein